MTFGEWLKRYRALHNLTQQKFAEQLGYSVITYRRVEQGTTPSPEFIEQVMRYLALASHEREAFIQFAQTDQHVNPEELLIQLTLSTTEVAKSTSSDNTETIVGDLIASNLRHPATTRWQRLCSSFVKHNVNASTSLVLVGLTVIMVFLVGVVLINLFRTALTHAQNPHTVSSTTCEALTAKGTNPAESSIGVLDPQQGSVTVWLKLQPDVDRTDHIIFASYDSRYALLVDRQDHEIGDIFRIAARAGGNRQMPVFPEAYILIDNDGSLQKAGVGEGSDSSSNLPFPDNEWHLITMTWEGYPTGFVHIYLNEHHAGVFEYHPSYDDGRPLDTNIVVGELPYAWNGECVQNPDGTMTEWGPTSTMSLAEGGIAISGFQLHTAPLDQQEIEVIVKESRPSNSKQQQ